MPQLYKVKNFATYTLLAPISSGTGLITVSESLSAFVGVFPLRAEIYDTLETFSATKEIVEVSLVNTGTNQFNLSLRGQEDTVAAIHPAGAKIRFVITAAVINNIVDEIIARALQSDLTTTNNNIASLIAQGNIPVTASIVTGEAYPAITTDPNGSGPGLPTSGPTCLTMLSTGCVRTDGNTSNGNANRLCVAYEASTGSAETHRVYLPSSIVTGFTGLIPEERYYPSAAVLGGWSRTQGVFWKLVGIAINTTTMLIVDGYGSILHSVAGTAGTNSFNNGVSNSLSRLDHEHKVYYEFCPLLVAPFAGQTTKWFANKTPFTYDVVSFYAVTDGAVSSSGATAMRLEKTSQTDINGAASGWSTMFSADPVIAVNQRSTEGTGSTNGTLSVTTLAPGEHLRCRITALGSGIGDISVITVLKLKNTN